MRVLALNGSPRMASSSTNHMLTPLLDGMEQEGAEIELIHLRKMDIKACIGCYTCWVRTPGECIFHGKDEMQHAMESYNKADMVIFGTPLYHFSMSGILKDFIDRTLPRFEPWLIPHPSMPELTAHPERFHKPTKMMLVSPCGFPEFAHFDALVATFKQMADMEGLEYVGEILRPGAETLSRKTHQPLFGAYYDILREAGREIMRDGRISEATAAALKEDLFPVEKSVFYDLAENYWTEQMDRFKVPEEKRHTVPILASDLDSVPFMPQADAQEQVLEVAGMERAINEDLMIYLAAMYDGSFLPDLRASIQFVFTEPEESKFDPGAPVWCLDIAGVSCTVREGAAAIPTLTITVSNSVWQQIGLGLRDSEKSFTEGEFEAEGSMKLLGCFSQIFCHPQPGDTDSYGDLETDIRAFAAELVELVDSDMKTVVQLVIGGVGGGIFHLRIDSGNCSAYRQATNEADLSLNASVSSWFSLRAGKAGALEEVRISGDSEQVKQFQQHLQRIAP